ncbi:MAG: iron-sulfur cluster assembly protein [Patescibacteria group bacterium]
MENSGLYQETILERARRPRNFGEQTNALSATIHNRSCGDHYTIHAKPNATGALTVTFTGTGCVISLASADILCDVVNGKATNEALTTAAALTHWLTGTIVAPDKRLLIFAGAKTRFSRRGCVLTPWQALTAALKTIEAPTPDEAVTTETIYAALRKVMDPELMVSIVDLGLVYDVKIDTEHNVMITMTFTTPHCPAAEEIVKNVHEIVGTLPHIGKVTITITFTPPWTRERINPDVRFALGV